jgi:hypothetical protein
MTSEREDRMRAAFAETLTVEEKIHLVGRIVDVLDGSSSLSDGEFDDLMLEAREYRLMRDAQNEGNGVTLSPGAVTIINNHEVPEATS